jgi:phosphate transport system protein
MNDTSHISHDYNEELESLRDKVLTMGGLVEEIFTNSTKALLKNNIELANSASEQDHKVNAMEVDIDEECASIIARRAPTAIDLRNLFAISKVVTDLERIGDESEKIARFAIELEIDAKSMNIYKNLKSMVNSARDMLKDALDCYARLDSEKALEITQLDSELDNEFEKLNRLLSTYLLEDSKNIKSILKVMWCARSIERVGDHAKNICEYVVYIVRGKDVRHIEACDGK